MELLVVFMRSQEGKPISTSTFCCSYKVVPEQKARTTYENLLLLADDPDVKDVLRYLRQREIVHYQRFAEGLEMVKEQLDSRNFYAFNPSLSLK